MGYVYRNVGSLYTFMLLVWCHNIIINHPAWPAHVHKHDTKLYGNGEAALAMFP